MLCPTIGPNRGPTLRGDLILQPLQNGMGNFSYQLSDRSLFSFEHNRFNCATNDTDKFGMDICDQCRISPRNVNSSGIFQVKYTLDGEEKVFVVAYGMQYF